MTAETSFLIDITWRSLGEDALRNGKVPRQRRFDLLSRQPTTHLQTKLETDTINSLQSGQYVLGQQEGKFESSLMKEIAIYHFDNRNKVPILVHKSELSDNQMM